MRNLTPQFILKQFAKQNYSGTFKTTTMFCDISGFTRMTEELMKNGKEGAEVLLQIINSVFTPAINSVYSNHGFVSTFGGDSFYAVFPNVESIHALYAASEIKNAFKCIGRQKTKFGEFNLSVKIGISYGEIKWGIVGSKDSVDQLASYYFKGEVIDNCSECEKKCSTNEIIFDSHVFEVLQDCSSINYSNIKKQYFLLNSITTGQINSSKISIPLEVSSASSFQPLSIIAQTIKGEFRDVVSCFISFEDTKDWENQVSEVINLARKYGGYFNRISFGDKGRFLLVFFGAPKALENDISHALAFVLKVLQMENFEVKIGITSGTAFAGFTGSEYRAEYTCQGKKVNLASRFMMKAKFGEIFVDESTAKKADDLYEFNKLPQMVFKHFPDKLDVFQLLGSTVTQNRLYNSKLVGRESELKKLKSFIQPIFSKKFAGIIYVDGSAGLGKSRVVNEFKIKYTSSSVNWFYMPCDEILQNSFNPIIYFLNSYFDQSDKNSTKVNKSNFEDKLLILKEQIQSKINHESFDEILAELERTKSVLGSLINLHWHGSLFEKLGAKAKYNNILIAFKNLIKAEALIKPVIIELEDGHWIDSDTKQLLAILTGNIEKFPIAVISACRYNDDGSEFSLDINKNEVIENRIKLKHLLPESSETLISEYLNQVKLPEETVKLVTDKSEGNPFYIEQICLYLQENHLLDSDYKITTNELEIPSNISVIIISRIDRLATELKTVIKTASVLGREFATDILSKMLLTTNLSSQLKDGIKERIWESISEIRYLFHHALIREAVYEMQLKGQLRELHRLAAETIEVVYQSNLEPHYYELANHYEKSELQDKAIEYLRKAGFFARANYQKKQAINLFQRLLLVTETELAKLDSSDTRFSEIIK